MDHQSASRELGSLISGGIRKFGVFWNWMSLEFWGTANGNGDFEKKGNSKLEFGIWNLKPGIHIPTKLPTNNRINLRGDVVQSPNKGIPFFIFPNYSR